MLAFVRHALRDDEAERFEAHLDGCELCGELVAALARSPLVEPASTTGPTSGSLPVLLPRSRVSGDRIGRYRIVRELGRGGMGVVFAARDPHLRRHVALKLVRPRESSGSHAGAARLLLEARALARIDNPHVVEVYDVGVDGEEVFIAMRQVSGPTLRAYAQRSSVSWQEVLDRFLEAGRGLVAAHAAGIVHRDFKPSNVLVDTGDVAVVVDFGLAFAERVQTPLELEVEVADHDPRLTATREVLGTPRYMAPEQWEGREATEASDQYAYCVSMFECLYGTHPFQGRFWSGEPPVDPVRRRGVPDGLLAVLRKGLAASPGDRHRSMSALLLALQEAAVGPSSRRRRVLLGLGIPVLGMLAWAWPRTEPGCADPRLAWDGVWDGTARQELRQRFVGTDAPWADDAFEHVEPALDRFVQRWTEAHERACRLHAQPDAEKQRGITRCLQTRRESLVTLLELWRVPDSDRVARAPAAVDALPDPRDCLAPVSTLDERGLVLQTQLEQAVARYEAGDLQTALQQVRALQAEAIDDPALLARLELERGRIAMATGDHELAGSSLRSALWRAQSSGLDELAARASNELTWLEGYFLMHLDQAREHGRRAAVAIERLGGDDELESVRLRNLGWVEQRAGDAQKAEQLFRAALELTCESCRDRWIAHSDLGTALTDQGRYPEAIEQLERAVEGMTSLVGPHHPDLGVLLNNLASNHRHLGRYEEALATYDRIASLFAAAHGPNHQQVGQVHLNRGTVLADSGRLQDSIAAYDRAEEILHEAVGPDHPDVARVHDGRATVLYAQQNYEQAIVELERALAIKESALGTEHPQLAVTLANLGMIRTDAGQLQAARIDLMRARDLVAEHLGPEHPYIAVISNGLGTVARRQGRVDEAEAAYQATIALESAMAQPAYGEALTRLGVMALDDGRASDARVLLERALEVHRGIEGADPVFEAETLLHLAEARARTGARASAREAAQRAAALFESRDLESAQEARAWLRRH